MRKVLLLCILIIFSGCTFAFAQEEAKIDGRTYQQWLYEADSSRDKEEYDNAIKAATNALLLNGKSDYAYFIRGVSYTKLAIYHQANTEFTEAININNQQASYYIWRAFTYSKRNINDEAIADFTRAIELDPNSSYSYFKRGQCYQNIGSHSKAIADFDKAESLSINSIYIPFYKAVSFEGLGEKAEAIKNYKLFLANAQNIKSAKNTVNRAEDRLAELEK